MEQLGAELRGHHVVLCEESEAPDASTSLAEITLDLSARAVLSLEVHDAVTEKRLERDLPLGSVPRDALALSIALAAEELLHASWIEAALSPPAESAPQEIQLRQTPQVVREVNAEQVARMPDVRRISEGPSTQVALVAAADHATGGETGIGGDVTLSWGSRVAVRARVGFRHALDVESTHGSVSGSEQMAGLGVDYRFVPSDRPWGYSIGARADAVDVTFSGVENGGAPGKSGSQFTAIVGGAVGGWVRIGGPWHVVAEATAGAPVRAVAATDVGSRATGVSGVALGAELGVSVTLPR